jgi:hypothetical protein
MSSPAAINSQITDAVIQAHRVAGDESLTILATLMDEIAKSLERASQGETTIDDLSDAFENAEVAMHTIIARLATGKK